MFPPTPAVRRAHRGQRLDQVMRMAALRGPRRPAGCEGFTRVVLARSAPASAAGAPCESLCEQIYWGGGYPETMVTNTALPEHLLVTARQNPALALLHNQQRHP